MTTRTTNPRRWAILTAAVLGVLVIYLALQAARRAFGGDVSDFRAYYTAAAEMRAGRDPYQPAERPYLYPPLLAFLCMPLTSLPIAQAALVYLPAILLATLLSLCLAPKTMLEFLEVKPDTVLFSQVVLLTLLVMFDRMKSDAQMFQVNSLMLLMFTLGLYWLDRRPWLAGSALGFALNIKGQSLVMLPYLLIRRRWSAAAAMVGAALGFALLPGAVIGWNANFRNLARLLGGLQTLADTHAPEQSSTHLVDVTARLSVSVTSGVARILMQVGFGRWLWLVVGVLATAALGYAFWAYRRAGIPVWRWPERRQQDQAPWRSVVALEWSCLILATLVFNPQTNTRHFLLALLPVAMAATVLRKPIPRNARIMMLVGIAALFAGLTLPPGNRQIAWLYDLKQAWFFIGGPCWLILLALGLFLWAGLQVARTLTSTASGTRTVPVGSTPQAVRPGEGS